MQAGSWPRDLQQQQAASHAEKFLCLAAQKCSEKACKRALVIQGRHSWDGAVPTKSAQGETSSSKLARTNLVGRKAR